LHDLDKVRLESSLKFRGGEDVNWMGTLPRDDASDKATHARRVAQALRPTKKTKEQHPEGGDPAQHSFISEGDWWVNSILHLDWSRLTAMATNDTPRTIYLPSTGGYTSSRIVPEVCLFI
jgi:hypothetical protein